MALFAWKASDAESMSKMKHAKHESSEHHEKMEDKLNSLALKMDKLLSNFEKMEQRITKIETRLNETPGEQKDEFKEKILKDIESMKEEISKLSLNDNPTEQQKLKTWLNDTVKLPQYFDTFIENDIHDLSAASKLTMEGIKAMGIDCIEDQTKILNQILELNQTE